MKRFKHLAILISIIISPTFSKLSSYNPNDIDRLLSGQTDLKNCDFSDLDLSDENLEGKDFAGANFEDAILNGTKFNNSSLKNANFSNVEAIAASFIGCVMRKTDCSNANFKNAIFGNRKIHNWNCADMRGAILLHANFDGANLDKVDLRRVLVDEHTDFSNSSMFLVNINREIFNIVKYQNIFLIEKPDDRTMEGLITELSQLKLERLRKIRPPKPTTNPEKLFVEQECPICLENFVENETVAMLPCGHIFHIECVKEWFSIKYECPSCRFGTNWFKPVKLEN